MVIFPAICPLRQFSRLHEAAKILAKREADLGGGGPEIFIPENGWFPRLKKGEFLFLLETIIFLGARLLGKREVYSLWTLRGGLCNKLCKSRDALDIVFLKVRNKKIRAFLLWKDLFHSKISKDFLVSVEFS